MSGWRSTYGTRRDGVPTGLRIFISCIAAAFAKICYLLASRTATLVPENIYFSGTQVVNRLSTEEEAVETISDRRQSARARFATLAAPQRIPHAQGAGPRRRR